MFEQSKWFFDEFSKIFEANSEFLQQANQSYQHNTEFTNFIIERINQIIKSRGWVAQNEYFRIDCMGYKSRYKELEKTSGLTPHLWDMEIAVEHENDDKDWLDEVIKLAHVCCPLRVVIGYVPEDKRSDDQNLLDYAANALKRLKCVDNVTRGEFMIILGNSNTKGKVENYFNYQAYILNAETFKFENYNLKREGNVI